MTIGLKAVFTASDQISGVALRAQASVLRFTKSAGEGLGKLDAFNSKIGEGLKTTALAVGAIGTVGGFAAKNVLDAGAEFEQAITNVGAVSLMTRDQIGDLEKKALDLGASTKFSATEVANAMEMMGKAGFENADILSGIGGILSAAAAEGAGLEETASNISNVLRGMGLAVTDSTRVADVLTLASARTNSSISSLGESMKNVSPIARQLGVPLEDTVSMVANLQNVGLDASEAGSALATMLTKLSAPTKEISAQMAAMGVKFQDAKGNMLAPTVVLEQLVKAGKKAGGNMKQVAFFADLVGLRGQKAALNLKDLFAKGEVSKLTEELKGAAGSADKMASIRMDTLLGDWEQLGGAVDSFKIGLFNTQNGPLRAIVQDMAKWVDANRDVITSGIVDFIKDAIPVVQGFGEGMRDGMKEFLPVIKGVSQGLASMFGGGGSGQGPQAQAYFLAKNILKAAEAFAVFSLGTKVARGGLLAIELATKGTKVVTWMWDLGKSTKAAIDAFRIAAQIGPSSIVAMGDAMNGLGGGLGSVAENGGKVAGLRGGLNAAFDGWAAKAGLAAAAIAAVSLAIDQGNKFLDENGGWEGFKGFIGAGADPTKFGFEGIDAAMNDQAKRQREIDDAKAQAADGMPAINSPSLGSDGMPRDDAARLDALLAKFGQMPQTPPAYTTGAPGVSIAAPQANAKPVLSADELQALKGVAKQQIELTVKTPEGTTAEVTKRPKGGTVSVKPTGGWFD